MPEQITKQNRRISYTRQLIKDTLLEIMKKKTFEKLSISALCMKADISRSTFYAHYNSLDEILDELVEEAFEMAAYSSSSLVLTAPERMHYLLQFDTVDKMRAHNSDLPPCQRIADDPKYRVLFLDKGLSDYIQNKLFLLNKDYYVPDIMEYCHVSEDEARRLFRYMLSGAYEVNASQGWVKDDTWFMTRINLTRLEVAGIDAIREANSR